MFLAHSLNQLGTSPKTRPTTATSSHDMCSVKCRRGDHAVQPRVHARATRHGQPDAAARWSPLEGRARLPSRSTVLSIFPSRGAGATESSRRRTIAAESVAVAQPLCRSALEKLLAHIGASHTALLA